MLAFGPLLLLSSLDELRGCFFLQRHMGLIVTALQGYWEVTYALCNKGWCSDNISVLGMEPKAMLDNTSVRAKCYSGKFLSWTLVESKGSETSTYWYVMRHTGTLGATKEQADNQ